MNRALLTLLSGGRSDPGIFSGLSVYLPLTEGTGTALADLGLITNAGCTLSSGGTWSAPGKTGPYCVDLDGSAGHIVIPTNTATDALLGAITVAVWIRPDTWTAGLETVASKQSSGAPYPSWDFRHNGGLEAAITVGGVGYAASMATAIQTGAWQLVGFTYDGKTLRTWLNGAQDGTPTVLPGANTPLDPSNGTDIWFGGNPSFPSGRYFDGKMDSPRVYNRALSAAEWKALAAYPPSVSFGAQVAASCHFTLMTYIPLSENPDEIGVGTEDINRFNPPPSFTWDNWMNAAVAMGATTVVYTTKHCDGLTMWPSKVTPGHTVADTTWGIANKRDIVGEFVAAARARNLKVGFYFAVGDNYQRVLNGGFGGSFTSTTKAQLTELLTNYGDIQFVVLDAWGSWWTDHTSGFPGFTDIGHATLYNHIKSLQPRCLIGVNNHDDTSGDFRTYEETVEGEPKSGVARPQVCWRIVQRQSVTAAGRWFMHSDTPQESTTPSVRLATLAQQKMLDRNYVMLHNFSISPDGLLRSDLQAIVSAIAATTVPPLWKGLELCFKFDEALATDGAVEEIHKVLSGGGYLAPNLDAVANPTAVAGKLGGARLFNGSTQYFQRTPTDPTSWTSLGDRNFSWTGWASFASIVNFPIVFAKDFNGSGPAIEYEFGIDTSGGAVPQWRVCGDGTNYVNVNATSFGNISANVPFFFVVTHDAVNNKISIQINGGAVDRADWANGVAQSVWPFTVGCRGAGLLPANCWVDTLSLYMDRVITQAEGLQMYNGGAGLVPFSGETYGL